MTGGGIICIFIENKICYAFSDHGENNYFGECYRYRSQYYSHYKVS